MTRGTWHTVAFSGSSRASPLLQGMWACVGASLLAMEANDNAGHLTLHGALRLIAGKPAPTRDVIICRSEHARDGGQR